ncbi:putative halogenase [Mycena belliarum]|uniref:Halogenase n=1 Tax=Mycena belliarum TaxID=1033014 RepID=A0AAD6UC34_9AGAR|nr:putative halogenase [Mycena belliae]
MRQIHPTMSAEEIPTSTNILVIGGGPAGSFAAAALARDGFEVTLLEREHFPRYHIGETMLPSMKTFLRFVGAEKKVADFGFTVKPGAALKLNQTKREGYTDFINPDPKNHSWNVTRAEFDEILLRNASESGARVIEGVSVTQVKFSPENDKQPVSADWKSDTGSMGEIKFNWLVDASGRNGIMSTKYLKNRRFSKTLRSVAWWGYWTGTNKYSPGTSRENAPWFEALTDESGWAWFIPLHGGKVSVGFVLRDDVGKAKKAEASGPDPNVEHYHNQFKFVPGLKKLLGNAQFLGEVKSAGDYSYNAAGYGGPHFRIAGDAGAFIDPLFSSGVHLAFGSALSAACTIAASIRGQCTEEQAIQFHTEKTKVSYTRFMVVVLGVYKQITSQEFPVLSDIDEDNFDRAFDFIRPVIQGATDTDPTVTEAMVQDTIDFCAHASGFFTDPEMEKEVSKRMDPALMATDGPIMGPNSIAAAAGDDEQAKLVLQRLNARKAISGIKGFEPNFRGENFAGFALVAERGNLGLVSVAA